MNKSSLQLGVERIAQAVKLMPSKPGVYKMISKDGTLLYVGKAKVLPQRVISYTMVEQLPYRLKMMVSQVDVVDFLITDTESQALLLEANLIQTLNPKYNILLKDDRSFPYILIEENHIYPRITKYRGTIKKELNYFGPFASAGAVNECLDEMHKIFKLRPCSDQFFATRTRPCIQYQIKRCSAPCVNKISQADYQTSIKQAKDFLQGRNTQLQSSLQRQMEMASNALEYEKAAEIRDRIKVLSQIQARNTTTTGNLVEADVFALYQDLSGNCCIQVFLIRNNKNYGNAPYFLNSSEATDKIMEEFIMQFYQLHKPAITIVVSHPPSNKKVLIEALNTIAKNKVRIIGKQFSNHIADLIELTVNNAQQSLSHSQKQSQKQLHSLQLLKDCFALRNLPNVIEIYDNSHLQGSHAFGCYVAAENGALNKKLYRTFKIKSIQGAVGDDYAMLAETITRRAKKLTDANRPNLLIIDGGKGQLSCVMQTLKNLNWHDVEVVCMSKGPERNSGREFFHQPNKLAFQLPIGDPALSYLHMLRNEAHRFAITTHRRSILKTVKKSGIDSVPQIGPARKTALLSYFGSFELLKNASMIDIARVPGISKKIAKMIINYLHNHTND